MLGLVYGWLPVYCRCTRSLDRLDRSLVEAARDLYIRRAGFPAGHLAAFAAGRRGRFDAGVHSVAGAFVTPAITGRRQVTDDQRQRYQQPVPGKRPFGSALSTLMMVIMLFATFRLLPLDRPQSQGGTRMSAARSSSEGRVRARLGPWALVIYILAFAFLYLPIIIVVIFSFNDSRSTAPGGTVYHALVSRG